MEFEIAIDVGDLSPLYEAGLDAETSSRFFTDLLMRRARLPTLVPCRYFLSEIPQSVALTLLSYDRARIRVDDEPLGAALLADITRFVAQGPRPKRVDDPHFQALWRRVEACASIDEGAKDPKTGDALLSRPAQEALMALCEGLDWRERGIVYEKLRGVRIPRADRPFVATWLMKRFAIERSPRSRDRISEVFMNRRELISRSLANDAISLLGDRRYGVSRSGIVYVLARTKDPRAADAIASVIHEEHLAWSVLRALGELKATKYAELVEGFVSHSEARIRSEARRTWRKLERTREAPPPAIHLVKRRAALPTDLEEWSTAVDREGLSLALRALSGCVEVGLGEAEIAEVQGVVDTMKLDETRIFSFPITCAGGESELWLSIFMDDEDDIDFGIYGAPAVVRRIGTNIVGASPDRSPP